MELAKKERSEKILAQINKKYPGSKAYDLDGFGEHFVCEVEPAKDHPQYDRAVEVIFKSRPHKHLKTTQKYTILSGDLKLNIDGEEITLKVGDTFTINPGVTHWAQSNDGCWVEIYSEPGWTPEDHIPA